MLRLVLILVVVDDSLVPIYALGIYQAELVLILVVVDDSLVPIMLFAIQRDMVVLILVVVDDSLVLSLNNKLKEWNEGLNPCCSGR